MRFVNSLSCISSLALGLSLAGCGTGVIKVGVTSTGQPLVASAAGTAAVAPSLRVTVDRVDAHIVAAGDAGDTGDVETRDAENDDFTTIFQGSQQVDLLRAGEL